MQALNPTRSFLGSFLLEGAHHYLLPNEKVNNAFLKGVNPPKGLSDSDFLDTIQSLQDYKIHRQKIIKEIPVGTRSKTLHQTPLHLAALYGTKEDIAHLLSRKAQINLDDFNNWTPLHFVARYHPENIDCLLSKGANPNAQETDRLTPLHLLARYHPKYMQLLIDDGAHVNAKEVNGRTPLFFLVLNHPEDLEVLIKAKAEVNIQDSHGLTPLHYLATKNPQFIPVLIEAGANVNALDGAGLTALHYVAEQSPEHMQVLIDAGAKVNPKTLGDELTPLHFLAENHPQFMPLLMQAGADLYAKSHKGENPLDFLVKYKGSEIEGDLLELKDPQKQTPLHIFAKSNQEKHLQVFINRGANIWLKDSNGKTAMDVAKKNHSHEAIKILEKEAKKPLWRVITVYERDAKGNLIEAEGKQKESIYLRNGKTNDLYFDETRVRLMAKSAFTFVATPIFMVAAMVTNIAKILSDIALIAFSFYTIFREEGFFSLLKQIPISLAWQMPKAVANRIWRALCAPFYAIKMMGLCLYTCYDKNEGRKTMNQTQESWDERGLLWLAGLEKAGNLSASKVGSFARFHLRSLN